MYSLGPAERAPLIGASHQPSVVVSTSCFNSRSEIKSGGVGPKREGQTESETEGRTERTTVTLIGWGWGLYSNHRGQGRRRGVLRDLTTGLLLLLLLLRPLPDSPYFGFGGAAVALTVPPRASRHLDRSLRPACIPDSLHITLHYSATKFEIEISPQWVCAVVRESRLK